MGDPAEDPRGSVSEVREEIGDCGEGSQSDVGTAGWDPVSMEYGSGVQGSQFCGWKRSSRSCTGQEACKGTEGECSLGDKKDQEQRTNQETKLNEEGEEGACGCQGRGSQALPSLCQINCVHSWGRIIMQFIFQTMTSLRVERSTNNNHPINANVETVAGKPGQFAMLK